MKLVDMHRLVVDLEDSDSVAAAKQVFGNEGYEQKLASQLELESLVRQIANPGSTWTVRSVCEKYIDTWGLDSDDVVTSVEEEFPERVCWAVQSPESIRRVIRARENSETNLLATQSYWWCVEAHNWKTGQTVRIPFPATNRAIWEKIPVRCAALRKAVLRLGKTYEVPVQPGDVYLFGY